MLTDLKISDGRSGSNEFHFECVPLKEVLKSDVVLFRVQVMQYVRKMSESITDPLSPYTMQYQATVLQKLSILRNGIENEVGLRFALADPILGFLCAYWGLRVCVCGNVCEWLLLLQGAEL